MAFVILLKVVAPIIEPLLASILRPVGNPGVILKTVDAGGVPTKAAEISIEVPVGKK